MYPEIIDNYNIESELKNKAANLIRKNGVGISRLSDKFLNKKAVCLKYKNDIVRLAVVLKASEETYKKYREKGINDEVFFDTMDDIRIWCEENGNKGLKNYNWIKNHIHFELFKIGRLQFQILKFPYVIYDYRKTPIKFRENVIAVHIPKGERLDYNKCVSSIESAKIFFSEYFPEYHYRFFICDSWLLYNKNKEFMNENSNIMKFQTLFTIPFSRSDDAQAIERIFGKKEKDVSCYKQETSLQRSAREYMLKGGKLGTGFGYIKA